MSPENDFIFRTLGASNHVEEERQQEDFYATEPKAAELLLQVEPDLKDIWECACGMGHLANVFAEHDKLFLATDIINRGYGGVYDFLTTKGSIPPLHKYHGDIVTNPPYTLAQKFIQRALDTVEEGCMVCMFLKLTFLESKARQKFFLDNPPKTIYVSSSRIKCAKNGDFEKYPSSAIAYAWYVWEKGFTGDPIIKWIN